MHVGFMSSELEVHVLMRGPRDGCLSYHDGLLNSQLCGTFKFAVGIEHGQESLPPHSSLNTCLQAPIALWDIVLLQLKQTLTWHELIYPLDI